MYNSYFGFKEPPFSIAPDPRYLYMTDQHREALAHLVYGLNSEGGCILLTGEVGTGKTTVCRCLLEQIPEKANIALVLNPKVSAMELLETICDELHIRYPEGTTSIKDYTDRINRFLLEANARGEKTVLIIDEAQNLDSSVLEQLRLLTNLETNQRKLLQIIILGQPELLEILSRDEMRQLAQRITARFHLKPLAREEVKAYLGHRLAVAGSNVQLFQEKAIRRLYRLSKGIPRIINIIADRALLGAYVESRHQVDTATLNKAATEVFGESGRRGARRHSRVLPLAAAAAAAGLAIVAGIALQPLSVPQPSLTVAAVNGAAPRTGIETPAATVEPVTAVTAAEGTGGVAVQPVAAIDTPDAAGPGNPPQTASREGAEQGLEALFADAANHNRSSAYRELFKLWQQDYDANRDGNACDFATLHSLSCLHRQGNLRSLALLNRPAVLKLYSGQSVSYALLTRLEDEAATLVQGPAETTVDVATLNRYWLGEYTLLWQTPPYYNHAVQPGAQGPIVQWLDQQLVRLYGSQGVPTISNTYNEELMSQIKRFQLSKGLIPDGVAGPHTLILLNSELQLSTPKLKTGKG